MNVEAVKTNRSEQNLDCQYEEPDKIRADFVFNNHKYLLKFTCKVDPMWTVDK